MDIDEKEMIACYRQKRIKRKLLKVSAKEIARHIYCLACESCEGCTTTHLSQTHHMCLYMGKFKRLKYFDAALQRASETAVMKMFTESLSAADFKYSCSTSHRTLEVGLLRGKRTKAEARGFACTTVIFQKTMISRNWML